MRFLCALLLLSFAVSADVRIDTAEAGAVLAMLGGEDQWARVLASEGYVRLKQREAAMGRAFSDSEFRSFVDSAELKRKGQALAATLAEWKQADIDAIGRRVRSYLPSEAELNATVYIVIKPQSNSFVFEVDTNPAIFLYLDQVKTKAQFDNTVAHELHHIGLASLSRSIERQLSPNVAAAVEWLGAFGEGLAMLAAAGSPDIHPHRDSPPEDRARWDRDSKNLERDMQAVAAFLTDILNGKLTVEQRREKGMSFFGTQGPWYTVGWRMAFTVEKAKGHAELLACMRDMRKLLSDYNDAAKAQGLPLWPDSLLAALNRP